MTRAEFSSALREALAGLDEGEIEKTAQFYDELIADHMDEGMGEEEAVGAVGSVEEIAREVLLDQPVAKLVKRRVRNLKLLKGVTGTLVVLGLPLWLPLLLAGVIVFLAVILALVAVVVAVCTGLWGVVLALALFAFLSVVGFSFTAAGLLNAGTALAAMGAALLLGYGMMLVTKGCAIACRGLMRGVRRVMMGRRKGDAHTEER